MGAYDFFTLLSLNFPIYKSTFSFFLLTKKQKKIVFFFSKMRTGADKNMVLPFEIERSNSICEKRRHRCTSMMLYFFQIPSHFCARNVQSSAIFKTKKTGCFFLRQQILREAQAKKK